jgi:predicted aminopeptidase
VRGLGLALIGIWLSGCYLGHVAAGQARLLWARQPISEVVRDPATPDNLRQQLERVLAVRDYAARLGLDVQDRYRHYAPWPGDQIVTTLVATRPGELAAAGFWFPIVGRVPYKGYFDAERAGREAERLRRRGLDVCTVPVRAYSTLGWFDDPVTGPMLRQSEGALVETLLHELVHATAFVPGDAQFNEGVASFVGEEASVRFFGEAWGEAAARRERDRVEQQRQVRSVLLELRQRIASLYAEHAAGQDRDRRRARLEQQARARVAALAGDPEAAADPQRLRLNDACLALTATYASDTACYARRLSASGGDLDTFVERLRESAEADDPRAALLGDLRCAATAS